VTSEPSDHPSASLHDVVRSALAGIAPEADLDSVGPDDDLREALDLDSMDLLRLLDDLESRTGVTIPEREYPRLQTLRGLIAELGRVRP
jgi:acyl carrier protein